MANHIGEFFHCKECLKELPEGQSPQDYARLSMGWTQPGFQVWCNRHNINVIHVHFEGVKHPADISKVGDFDLWKRPLPEETKP